MSLFGFVGDLLGGGGGDSNGVGNSKSTSDTTNSTATSNSDSRRINTGGTGINAADGSTINYTSTDAGAFGVVDSVIGKAFSNQALNSAALANAYADAKGNGANMDKIMYAAIAALVAVAFIIKKG